jgi:hypothetical protein
MKEIHLKLTSDEIGLLRIEVPVDQANQSYHVVVQLQAATPAMPIDELIEQTAGKWEGEFPDRDEDFRQYYASKDKPRDS